MRYGLIHEARTHMNGLIIADGAIKWGDEDIPVELYVRRRGVRSDPEQVGIARDLIREDGAVTAEIELFDGRRYEEFTLPESSVYLSDLKFESSGPRILTSGRIRLLRIFEKMPWEVIDEV